MVASRWAGKNRLQEQPACIISDSIHDCSGAAEGLHNAVDLGEADGARAVVCGIERVLHSCTRKKLLLSITGRQHPTGLRASGTLQTWQQLPMRR